jgi:hypothetical protein
MKHLLRYSSVAFLSSIFLTTACAHATHGAASAQNERTFCAKSTATLYVQNDNWMDVVVYAVRGGSRFRLGQVSSVQSAVFEIPAVALGASSGMFILVDPIGAITNDRMFATDDLMIAPGHTIIDLRVDNIIDHSSWSVAVEDPEQT